MGLISGWSYIRNKIFVGKWMSLYPRGRGGEVKKGGGLKSGILRYYPSRSILQFLDDWNLSDRY